MKKRWNLKLNNYYYPLNTLYNFPQKVKVKISFEHNNYETYNHVDLVQWLRYTGASTCMQVDADCIQKNAGGRGFFYSMSFSVSFEILWAMSILWAWRGFFKYKVCVHHLGGGGLEAPNGILTTHLFFTK